MNVLRCLTFVVASTLLAVVARAANFVENGDFETDLAGWYVTPSWILDSWSPLDANGSPLSGSIRMENVNDDGLKGGGTGQCVPVVEGEAYRVGFSIYVPSAQTGTGLAGLRFSWNASADCDSGSGIGGSYGTDGDWVEPGEWLDWRSSPLVAPPGAQAVLVDLNCRKTSVAGTFVAYWDDVFVVPEPRATSAQGTALLALVALQRRRRGSASALRARDCPLGGRSTGAPLTDREARRRPRVAAAAAAAPAPARS